MIGTGKPEGNRSKNRQRDEIMDSCIVWLEKKERNETFRCVSDRDGWRDTG